MTVATGLHPRWDALNGIVNQLPSTAQDQWWQWQGEEIGWSITDGVPTFLLIEDLQLHSHQTTAQCVFVAWPGTQVHGGQYVLDAVKKGVNVVFWIDDDVSINDDLPEWVPVDELWVLRISGLTRHQRQLWLGQLANAFYGHPSERLQLVGITGTNGKTSILTFIAQGLQQIHVPVATLGTLGMTYPDGSEDKTANTTNDCLTIHRVCAKAVALGAKVMVMEVSSHAVDQGRIEGLDFDVKVLSNVTSDHLDYHHTQANYAACKRAFFTQSWAETSSAETWVINGDDAEGQRLLQQVPDGITCVQTHRQIEETISDLSSCLSIAMKEVRCLPQGFSGQWQVGSWTQAFHWPVMGDYQLDNVLSAWGALHHLCDSTQWQTLTATDEWPFQSACGRLQRVHPLLPWFVDFAHTADGLHHVIAALRAHNPQQRIWVLCGAGGDRDRHKRPQMGRIAAEHADGVVLTSDNPRSEDPQAILADMAEGVAQTGRVIEECHGVKADESRFVVQCVDRAKAIDWLVKQASLWQKYHASSTWPVILLAGKGHEQGQIVREQVLPFSDQQQLAQAIQTYVTLP